MFNSFQSRTRPSQIPRHRPLRPIRPSIRPSRPPMYASLRARCPYSIPGSFGSYGVHLPLSPAISGWGGYFGSPAAPIETYTYHNGSWTWKPNALPSLTPSTPLSLTTPLTPAAVAYPRLHPSLWKSPQRYPRLDWDISRLPSNAQALTGPGTTAVPDFRALATYPPVCNMTLTSDNPSIASWMTLWGPIVVHAQDIKVEDIMDAIYNYFSMPLTWELPYLGSAIRTSFERRLGTTHNLWSYDRMRGPLRIDVLNGCTRFAGLRPVGFQGATQRLYLDLA